MLLSGVQVWVNSVAKKPDTHLFVAGLVGRSNTST